MRAFLDEDEQDEMRPREKEERNRRGKGKAQKGTKNQGITVLAGVVATGISVAVYQNQRGAQVGVLHEAEKWRRRVRRASVGVNLASRSGNFI